jgi:hypothetical protein
VKRLTVLGFAWAPGRGNSSARANAWNAQFARLAAYQVAHGDCNVPQRWAEDQTLASWVRDQRLAKKESRMTAARVERLTSLGFAWTPQRRGPKRKVWSTFLQTPCGVR